MGGAAAESWFFARVRSGETAASLDDLWSFARKKPGEKARLRRERFPWRRLLGLASGVGPRGATSTAARTRGTAPGILEGTMKGILVCVLMLSGLGGGIRAQPAWRLVGGSSNPSERSWHSLSYDSDRNRTVLIGGLVGYQVRQDTWEWDGQFWERRAEGPSVPGVPSNCATYDSKRRKTVALVEEAVSSTWTWDGATWSSVTPNPSPPAMFEGGLVFDANRGRVVAVGCDYNVRIVETWEWDGSQWTKYTVSPSPSKRLWHSMAYDSTRKKTVLFGGTPDFTTSLSDTWEWDGLAWKQCLPTRAPSGRNSSAMAFDPVSQRVILVGGSTAPGTAIADMWAWDGTNWTLLSQSAPFVARAGHSMATDTKRGRVVLFGGGTTTGYADDTWEWDGTTWLARSEPKPAKLYRHGLAYDAARSRTLLFGGYSYEKSKYYQDTWSFDGTSWQQLFPSTSPPPASGEWIASDTARKRIVLYDFSSGTWEWDGSTWLQRSGVIPNAGVGGGLAYDSVRGRTVMLCVRKNQTTILDTWEWDGSVWTQLAPTASPPVRTGGMMAYDEAHARVVLFGGLQSQTVAYDDTWEWDGTTWTQRFPANRPGGRMAGNMAYDRSRGRIVLHGGIYPSYPRPTFLMDTWEWDGTTWTMQFSLPLPPSRSSFGMAYDPRLGQCVIAGGEGDYGRFWDTMLYTTSSPASVISYGSGCPGGSGTPLLSAYSSSLPWLGETFRATLSNIGPSPNVHLPFWLLGDSRTSWGSLTLPLDLTGLGMPGCALHASPQLTLLSPNLAGQAALALPIPNFASLLGATLYAQGGVTDPDANLLGIVVSNGSAWRLGAR